MTATPVATGSSARDGRTRGERMRMNLRTMALAVGGGCLIALPALSAPNPERDAYFGETHVHTSWSLDAFAIGNVLTNPGDAYKYFKGEPIKHPLGFDVKIDTPRSEERRVGKESSARREAR